VQNFDQGSGDDTDHNRIATAGLVWQFGGPPPAPAAPADSDMDVIADSGDKCPNTPHGIMVDEFGCELKFTLQIEFDFNKAQVLPYYHAGLKAAAAFIDKYPGTKFLLAGHTDSIGSDKSNQGLSEKCAAAVKKYLVEECGIAAHLLHPRGYSESRPIADKTTRKGARRTAASKSSTASSSRKIDN